MVCILRDTNYSELIINIIELRGGFWVVIVLISLAALFIIRGVFFVGVFIFYAGVFIIFRIRFFKGHPLFSEDLQLYRLIILLLLFLAATFRVLYIPSRMIYYLSSIAPSPLFFFFPGILALSKALLLNGPLNSLCDIIILFILNLVMRPYLLSKWTGRHF